MAWTIFLDERWASSERLSLAPLRVVVVDTADVDDDNFDDDYDDDYDDNKDEDDVGKSSWRR